MSNLVGIMATLGASLWDPQMWETILHFWALVLGVSFALCTFGLPIWAPLQVCRSDVRRLLVSSASEHDHIPTFPGAFPTTPPPNRRMRRELAAAVRRLSTSTSPPPPPPVLEHDASWMVNNRSRSPSAAPAVATNKLPAQRASSRRLERIAPADRYPLGRLDVPAHLKPEGPMRRRSAADLVSRRPTALDKLKAHYASRKGPYLQPLPWPYSPWPDSKYDAIRAPGVESLQSSRAQSLQQPLAVPVTASTDESTKPIRSSKAPSTYNLSAAPSSRGRSPTLVFVPPPVVARPPAVSIPPVSSYRKPLVESPQSSRAPSPAPPLASPSTTSTDGRKGQSSVSPTPGIDELVFSFRRLQISMVGFIKPGLPKSDDIFVSLLCRPFERLRVSDSVVSEQVFPEPAPLFEAMATWDHDPSLHHPRPLNKHRNWKRSGRPVITTPRTPHPRFVFQETRIAGLADPVAVFTPSVPVPPPVPEPASFALPAPLMTLSLPATAPVFSSIPAQTSMPPSLPEPGLMDIDPPLSPPKVQIPLVPAQVVRPKSPLPLPSPPQVSLPVVIPYPLPPTQPATPATPLLPPAASVPPANVFGAGSMAAPLPEANPFTFVAAPLARASRPESASAVRPLITRFGRARAQATPRAPASVQAPARVDPLPPAPAAPAPATSSSILAPVFPPPVAPAAPAPAPVLPSPVVAAASSPAPVSPSPRVALPQPSATGRRRAQATPRAAPAASSPHVAPSASSSRPPVSTLSPSATSLPPKEPVPVISLGEQNWALPDNELLALNEDNWGMSVEELMEWEPTQRETQPVLRSSQSREYECQRNPFEMAQRWGKLALNIKKTTVLLRLQLLRSTHQRQPAFITIKRFQRLLSDAEKQFRAFSLANNTFKGYPCADFSAFTNALGFFMKHVYIGQSANFARFIEFRVPDHGFEDTEAYRTTVQARIKRIGDMLRVKIPMPDAAPQQTP